MDLANPSYMGQAAQMTNILPGIQSALLGQQQIKQNQNILDQQARADQARQAAAKIASTPNLDDATFESLLAPIAQADPNAASQMRRQRQMSRDLAGVMANPTAATIGRFGMTYGDEALKDIRAGWDMLDGAQKEAALKTSHDVYSYLRAGAKDQAIAILQSQADAAKQNGEDPSHYTTLIDLVRNNPKGALTIAGMNLAAAMGPEKFVKLEENARENELQPGRVAEGQAKASIAATEAAYKPQTIQSDLATQQAQRERMAAQTANEQAEIVLKRAGLDLQRDQLQSSIQLKLEELDRNGTQLDAGARNAVNTAVGESTAAAALADRMNNLADRMKGRDMGWGWASAAREGWKGMFGGQDPVSALRSEYNQLVNAQAVKNLPPGPASDKDIALAKQGFPPDSASGEYLQSFLRGMAKMQSAVAAAADRKANWISANGSLAPVRRDTNIGGVMVPAGTTFSEFNGHAVKRAKQDELNPAITNIIDKYGRR